MEMKTYKIKSLDTIIEVIQDEDGKFIIPEQFCGIGTGLKTAVEEWILCRKPLSEKTVAKNVLKWGCGGINIDKCRVSCNQKAQPHKRRNSGTLAGGGRSEQEKYGKSKFPEGDYGESNFRNRERMADKNPNSRFPANLILSCTCDEVIEGKERKEPYSYKGKSYQVEGFIKNNKPQALSNYNDTNSGIIHTNPECPCYMLDTQQKGASRFFYCAKVSRSERSQGCNGFILKSETSQEIIDKIKKILAFDK